MKYSRYIVQKLISSGLIAHMSRDCYEIRTGSVKAFAATAPVEPGRKKRHSSFEKITLFYKKVSADLSKTHNG